MVLHRVEDDSFVEAERAPSARTPHVPAVSKQMPLLFRGSSAYTIAPACDDDPSGSKTVPPGGGGAAFSYHVPLKAGQFFVASERAAFCSEEEEEEEGGEEFGLYGQLLGIVAGGCWIGPPLSSVGQAIKIGDHNNYGRKDEAMLTTRGI